jgi:hypothetical protein
MFNGRPFLLEAFLKGICWMVFVRRNFSFCGEIFVSFWLYLHRVEHLSFGCSVFVALKITVDPKKTYLVHKINVLGWRRC